MSKSEYFRDFAAFKAELAKDNAEREKRLGIDQKRAANAAGFAARAKAAKLARCAND